MLWTKTEFPIFRSLALSETADGPGLYYAFYILSSDGADIIGKPLMDCRRVLKRTIKLMADIQVGNYKGEGKSLSDLSKKGIELIISEAHQRLGAYRNGHLHQFG